MMLILKEKRRIALLSAIYLISFQAFLLEAFSQPVLTPVAAPPPFGRFLTPASTAQPVVTKSKPAQPLSPVIPAVIQKENNKPVSQPIIQPEPTSPVVVPVTPPTNSANTTPASAPASSPATPGMPVALPEALQARAVHALSLTDALTLMEKQNPQLVAARKNMDISQAGVRIAKEIPNPQFQAQHFWGNVVALGTNGLVAVTQQVETGGKRRKRTEAAKSQLRLTQAQYDALLWDLRSQTRQAYVQLAAAKENILLMDAQAELAQNLVNIANKRVTAGAAPISEYLQAQLAYSQIGTQQIQAVTQLQQARGQMNTLIGNPLTPGKDEGYDISDEGYFNGSAKTELVPFPNTAIPGYDALLKQAMEKRPDLVAAIRQFENNRDQLKLAKAQRIPDLYVSVGYPFLKLKPQYEAINNRTLYTGFWAQVAFNLPVYHNQGAEIKQAEHTLEQSQLQVKAVQQQLVGEIYSALQGLNGARDNIRLYRMNLLPSSDEVLKLAQKSYQVGKTGLTSVIVAQQQTQQIRQGYIQSVLDYHNAWSNLEKAVGSRLNF